MTPEAWQRIKAVFDAAVSLPAGERARFLDRACGADAALRAEVESLLAASDPEAAWLGTPAVRVTAPAAGPKETERDALLDALRKATLGEYEIQAEVGRGGMATVYLAHDLALDRKVAIKMLAPALLLMGEGMVERFKREARTAAALTHPHIIPIYTVKEADRVLYFVMKYVQGRPLDAIIRDVGPLPLRLARAILAQVADALGYAHRHGVIHRDIKSANIMLDEEGWAVVTDFGIAKVVQAEGLTVTGVTVGTPTYMSPEQCDNRELTGASDQYSLGVVGYEMLTGKVPFQGDSVMAVMYAHFNQRPRPLTELRADCPTSMAAAVMRMLEKDPALRWPSMDDVVAACGRPSLRHDDPVRSEMITLAKAGGPSRLLAHVKTPTSPIPPARPPTRSTAAVAPPGRRARRVWSGLAAVGLGVALWWAVARRASQPPQGQPSAAGRDTPAAAPAPAPAPAAATGTPAPSLARVPADTALPSGRAKRTPALRASPPPASPSAAAAAPDSAARAKQREDSLVRSLQATAVAAMRRALEAGASPADMAKGDTAFKGAESLAAHGQVSEAMVQLATAASLWAEAERHARSRAVADAAHEPALEQAHPAPDPRAQIESVIGDYARALESLDLAQVRRVYPGLTAAQQRGWKQFFESVRRLKAGLTVAAVNVTGGTAEAIVSGVYDYENATTGRAERRPVTFRAILVAEPGGWRLSVIR